MKKVLVVLGISLMFMGNVRALTFDKVVEKYKETITDNEVFTENNDKISVSNTSNSITTHFDLTEAEVEGLTELDVVFNYADGKLKYEYNGELKNDVDESKYLLNTIVANLMYMTIGDLNGYSSKQMEDTLTEEKTKSFTLDKNGIEISLLKYEAGKEEVNGVVSAGGVYFTKSFNLDLNKFNIGEKKEHAVYLEFSEVVSQFKKDFENGKKDIDMDCTLSNTASDITISCSKDEVSSKAILKYSDNVITYSLSSSKDFYQASGEMYIAQNAVAIMLKTIATFNKYSEEEIETSLKDIFSKQVSLENNGIEYKFEKVQNELASLEGLSNAKIDLTKFNLDNLLDSEVTTGEKCSEKDGLYFDKNGNSVSKEAYFESCGVVENPKTGLMVPFVILMIFGLMGLSLIVKRKTYFEKI